jgi:hypothetical protein
MRRHLAQQERRQSSHESIRKQLADYRANHVMAVNNRLLLPPDRDQNNINKRKKLKLPDTKIVHYLCTLF